MKTKGLLSIEVLLAFAVFIIIIISIPTPKKFGKFYFSELYTKTTTEKNVFFKAEKNNCLVQERFIILKNITEQKTILGVVLCEN